MLQIVKGYKNDHAVQNADPFIALRAKLCRLEYAALHLSERAIAQLRRAHFDFAALHLSERACAL